MAQSAPGIFNLALTELGQDGCTSIDDDIERVRVLRRNWEFVRDAVLAEHPWKFAIKRAELAALASEPLFGWSLQYALPEACLKVVQVGDEWAFYSADNELETFAMEGGRVLTDIEAPLQIRYVERKENVGEWPVLFGQAVAYKLASVCAKKITGSNTEAERVMGLYQLHVRTAKRHSAIERPPQHLRDGSWLDARGD